MRILHRGTPGVNSGPVAVRPVFAPDPAPPEGWDQTGPDPIPHPADATGAPTPSDPVGPIGYRFDAVPQAVRRDFRLKPIDHQLVALLVSLAIWRRDSCWTTVDHLARQVAALRPGRSGRATVCPRTIQRSLGRLFRCGHLRRDPVGRPDPDDPRNRTGHRYFFLWHASPDLESSPHQTATRATPGGVTKAGAEGPDQAGGGVTKESGDSLVTQERIKSSQKERETLNVAAPPGGDAPDPVAEPPEMASVPPPAPTVPAPLPPTPTPGLPAADPRRAAEARAMIRQIRGRGVHLWPDGATVRAQAMIAGAELPTGAEAEALDRLRSEVLLALREMKLGPPRVGPAPAGASASASTPTIPGGSSPGSGRPAPRVAEAAQAEVHRRIAALILPLPDRPGDRGAALAHPLVQAFAETLGGVLGDRNPTSRATATGLAADVLRGSLAGACLRAAFEEACGPGKRNRGASFVAGVRRWKSANGRGRATNPGACQQSPR